MSHKMLRISISLAVVLALVVVTLGAYTRLTNAGLGCPDWPGCYGHVVVPTINKAQEAFPQLPLESRKAWTEMVHRYAAGTLVLLVLVITVYILRMRKLFKETLPWLMPAIILSLIILQALLGMWTVTLKLHPLVVMGHLLGGMALFTCLCFLWGQLNLKCASIDARFHKWVGMAAIFIFLQIALGGWVSANYAGISCIGFPKCNGLWLPKLELDHAFNVLMPIGHSYEGGVMDANARMSILFVHRLWALVVAGFMIILMSLIIMNARELRARLCAGLALTLVMVQFFLGIMNVVYLLPLAIAVAHNGVAALLLATTVVLFYLTKEDNRHA